MPSKQTPCATCDDGAAFSPETRCARCRYDSPRTVFVRRTEPFTSPLPGEPDPAGVAVYVRESDGWHIAGSLHIATARKLHGDCPVVTIDEIPALRAYCAKLAAQLRSNR